LQFDVSHLSSVDCMAGETAEETKILQQMFGEASTFLCSFSWCREVCRAFLGFGVGKVVAVFLFDITPSSDEIDQWLWDIVGDLPPAYIVLDQSPDPKSALTNYIKEMRSWIEAVRTNGDLQLCIPVGAEPTTANALSLERRLTFIEESILNSHRSNQRSSA
jgi:hypothetical protein